MYGFFLQSIQNISFKIYMYGFFFTEHSKYMVQNIYKWFLFTEHDLAVFFLQNIQNIWFKIYTYGFFLQNIIWQFLFAEHSKYIYMFFFTEHDLAVSFLQNIQNIWFKIYIYIVFFFYRTWFGGARRVEWRWLDATRRSKRSKRCSAPILRACEDRAFSATAAPKNEPTATGHLSLTASLFLNRLSILILKPTCRNRRKKCPKNRPRLASLPPTRAPTTNALPPT